MIRPGPEKHGVWPNLSLDNALLILGAASLLAMLEDKADSQRITASELSAVRCIVKTCAADLDAAWANA